MVLRLNHNDFLRLRGARGVTLEVVGGRVWITEDGFRCDSFLAPGGRYRVGGDGLVLVGAERDETDLRVRDPGLRRDQIAVITASSTDTAAREPRAETARPG